MKDGWTIEIFGRGLLKNQILPQGAHASDFLVTLESLTLESGVALRRIELTTPTEIKKEQIAVGDGERNLVAQADLGKELLRLSGKPAYQEEVLEDFVQYELPDGTEIQGKRVRKTLLTSKEVDILHSYLEMSFDIMPETINFPSYGFKVNAQKLGRKAPFETVVTSYVTFDGQIVSEEMERVIPVLKVIGGRETFEVKYRKH
ncbi:hypothetical protein HYX13_01930 [Candidatus Woesearchaeota archaeon]|nr:hypothetical protein [Candidatus Woesearchaeota archaeon]